MGLAAVQRTTKLSETNGSNWTNARIGIKRHGAIGYQRIGPPIA